MMQIVAGGLFNTSDLVDTVKFPFHSRFVVIVPEK